MSKAGKDFWALTIVGAGVTIAGVMVIASFGISVIVVINLFKSIFR